MTDHDLPLERRHCQPLEGHPPMADADVTRHLGLLDGWRRDGASIEKSFRFTNFHETMAFVNAVAHIAHREDHHPQMTITYAQCTLRFDTHSVGGISVNDFICAAKVDALLA
jgi:4a-hydroxytetrahydrobiopterin dehydratase